MATASRPHQRFTRFEASTAFNGCRHGSDRNVLEAASTGEAKMSKRNKKPIASSVVPQVKPRAFVPRPCTACENDRPHGKNYSKVYSVHGNVRYCRCGFCGHTWKQIPSEFAIAIANECEKELPQTEMDLHSVNGDNCELTSTN